MNLSVEHVLMFVLFVCALHYFMNKCGCRRVEGIGKPCTSMDACEQECVSSGAGNSNSTWNICMDRCNAICPDPPIPSSLPWDTPTPAEKAKIECRNECSDRIKCGDSTLWPGNDGWNSCMGACDAVC